MRKLTKLVLGTIASLALAGQVYAGSLTIRLEQPKSPTNQNNFTITFTALDTDTSQTITVKCFKQAPGEVGFSQFGSDIVLSPSGGNTGNCQTNSGIITTDGTYNFYATATDTGSGTATSSTVSVAYNTSGPGTPTNWSKTKSSCTYTIGFVTANDAGKTIKVNIYRSTSASFNLDSGTLVGTLALGSNTAGSFPDTPPDCSLTYYYAVRAFDSADNGSGVLGDVVTTTTSASTSPTPAQGAIPVTSTGNVLGAGTGATGAAGASGTAGEALGQSSPSPEVVNLPSENPLLKLFSGKKGLVIGGLLLVVILYALAKFKENQS